MMALAAAKEELLQELTEAASTVPRAEQSFYLSVYDHGGEVSGGGLTNSLPVLEQDIYDLRNEGLLTDQASFVGGDMQFIISDDGWDYVARMRERGEPMAHGEAAVFSFIDGEAFQARHPAAYAKWRSAYRLAAEDPIENATRIGHDAREALAHFASSLLTVHGVTVSGGSGTVDKLRAVLAEKKPAMVSTTHAFLDALVPYWGTVSDLAQRQEHGAEKEGEPLSAGDARRLVFQTAVVMVEIDTALS